MSASNAVMNGLCMSSYLYSFVSGAQMAAFPEDAADHVRFDRRQNNTCNVDMQDKQYGNSAASLH